MLKRFLLSVLLTLGFVSGAYAQRTASNPLGGNLFTQDSGTCSTTNSYLWQVLPANAGTTTLNVTGTFSGTITVRESNNGGGTWSTAATITSAGTTTYATNGFTDFCADLTTFSSGIFQVSISTGLQQVQSVVTVQGSGGTSVTTISLLPVCGTTPNCYPLYADTKVITDAAVTSGLNTITCAANDCPTAADVTAGKTTIFCTNLAASGARSFATASVSLTTSTISVANGSSITVSNNASQNGNTCAWGHIDTANLAAAWTAVLAACPYGGVMLQLPMGSMLIDSAVFQTQQTSCVISSGSHTHAIEISGVGIDATRVIPLPTFNFASCTGPDQTFSGSCFGWGVTGKTIYGGMQLFNWQINGLGQTGVGSTTNKTGLYVPADAFIENFRCAGWGNGTPSVSGLATGVEIAGTGPARIRNLELEGCGQSNLTISSNSVIARGSAVFIEQSFFGNNGGNDGTAINGGGVVSAGNWYAGGTASNKHAVNINGSASFTSYGDTFTAGAGLSNQSCIAVTSGTPVVILQDMYCNNASTSALGLFQAATASTVTIKGNSTIKMTGKTSKPISQGSTAILYDIGANTYIGTSTSAISGTVFKSGSATGNLQTSGNWSVAAGSSAGQWGMSPSVGTCTGDATTEQCTITVGSVTVGANPVLTITFPTNGSSQTPFLVAPMCNATMVGGTATFSNFTNGTVSTTSAAFTYNGTPEASSTIILKVTCGL
jgi:hypothetical protein